MSNSRVIVSSSALRKAMMAALSIDHEDDRLIEFRCEGSSLFIQDQEVPVLVREWNDFSVERSQAKKLLSILTIISEQPIAIEYGDSGWFTIHELLI